MARALREMGLPAPEALLSGPTAITFCYNEVAAPAKALAKFAKDSKVMVLRGGILVADLGSVKAGATRTVRLSVRILRTAQGKRQHTATVVATCAATTRAALAANVRPLQGSVTPGVTG
jgi:ribosomal protein L10